MYYGFNLKSESVTNVVFSGEGGERNLVVFHLHSMGRVVLLTLLLLPDNRLQGRRWLLLRVPPPSPPSPLFSRNFVILPCCLLFHHEQTVLETLFQDRKSLQKTTARALDIDSRWHLSWNSAATEIRFNYPRSSGDEL